MRVILDHSYDPPTQWPRNINIASSFAPGSGKVVTLPNQNAIKTGLNWVPNTLYDIRVLACVDNTSAAKGWARLWVNEVLCGSYNNRRSGNGAGSDMRVSTFYHDYNPNGMYGVHMHRLECRKTGRAGMGANFPAAP